MEREIDNCIIYGFRTYTVKKNPGCFKIQFKRKALEAKKSVSQSYFEEVNGGPSLQDVSTGPRSQVASLILAS